MKRYFLAIVAVILAFGFSAFTIAKKTNHPNNRFASKWFQYNAGPQDDKTSYSLYVPTEEDPVPPNCEASTRLCAIFVNDANSNNMLDAAELSAYISSHDSDHDGSLDDEGVSADLIKKPQQ